VGWDPDGKDNFLEEDHTVCIGKMLLYTVMYRKNVALLLGCSIPAAE